jgi:ABC-2 family transporter protein
MQLTVVGSFAAAAVAADVEAGTIELLMARPISRARLLAERTTALVTGSLVVTTAATAAVAVGVATTPRLHETVSLGGVAAAGVLGLGLALCIAGPVLAVSAAGRHRSQVVGATIAFGAVGFAISFVAEAWPTVPSAATSAPSTTTPRRTRWSAARSRWARWRCCWPSSWPGSRWPGGCWRAGTSAHNSQPCGLFHRVTDARATVASSVGSAFLPTKDAGRSLAECAR